MSDVIKLVRNDNRPLITLTITDETTGAVLDLSGASVSVHFRKSGTTTVLATLACTFVTDGSDGKVRFNFAGSALDVEAGTYEGEIEITHVGGDKETLYEVLRFRVREEFA